MICETKSIEINADDVAQSKPTAATCSKAPVRPAKPARVSAPQCRSPWTDGGDRHRVAGSIRTTIAFEMSITAEFDAETAVERELVLRLASLLWRLRRSTAIVTGLLQISTLAEERPPRAGAKTTSYSVVSLIKAALSNRSECMCKQPEASSEEKENGDSGPECDLVVNAVEGDYAELALRFLRLATFD